MRSLIEEARSYVEERQTPKAETKFPRLLEVLQDVTTYLMGIEDEFSRLPKTIYDGSIVAIDYGPLHDVNSKYPTSHKGAIRFENGKLKAFELLDRRFESKFSPSIWAAKDKLVAAYEEDLAAAGVPAGVGEENRQCKRKMAEESTKTSKRFQDLKKGDVGLDNMGNEWRVLDTVIGIDKAAKMFNGCSFRHSDMKGNERLDIDSMKDIFKPSAYSTLKMVKVESIDDSSECAIFEYGDFRVMEMTEESSSNNEFEYIFKANAKDIDAFMKKCDEDVNCDIDTDDEVGDEFYLIYKNGNHIATINYSELEVMTDDEGIFKRLSIMAEEAFIDTVDFEDLVKQNFDVPSSIERKLIKAFKRFFAFATKPKDITDVITKLVDGVVSVKELDRMSISEIVNWMSTVRNELNTDVTVEESRQSEDWSSKLDTAVESLGEVLAVIDSLYDSELSDNTAIDFLISSVDKIEKLKEVISDASYEIGIAGEESQDE